MRALVQGGVGDTGWATVYGFRAGMPSSLHALPPIIFLRFSS